MLTHWIWFARMRGMNARQKLALLEHFQGPEEIYRTDRQAWKGKNLISPAMLEHIMNKDLSEARAIMKACAENSIGIVAFPDSAYPANLRNIDDPPLVLFYLGKLPAWELQPTVGVVGTRTASPYGLRTATHMAAQIAACGGIVASGGAMGIDTMALEGALTQGQKTVVVQAGGLDMLYPKENEKLYARVLKNGCILSEYPPKTHHYKGNFLRRNRIISGISNAVLVVEAPEKSGALNTARWASAQGKEIFAVPANVDTLSAQGSNAIIGDIAKAATNGWTIMREYEKRYPDTVKYVQPLRVENVTDLLVAQTPAVTASKPKVDKITVDKREECPYSVIENDFSGYSQEERTILEALSKTPAPADQVLEKLSMPAGEALSILTRLSLKGVVKYHPGNLISLN